MGLGDITCRYPPSGHTLRQNQSVAVLKSPAQFLRRDFFIGGSVLCKPWRKVMQAWADFCDTMTKVSIGQSNVVLIKVA